MKSTYTDLIMKTSDPVIKLNKPLITFKINSSYFNLFPIKKINTNDDLIPISECEINVTNITTNYVAVRVRTTKKNNYTVDPTFCTLSPNSTIKITIYIYLNQNEKLSSRGHKFRFEGVIIPDKLLNKDTREIFSELTKNKIEVKGNSLKRLVELINDPNFDYKTSKKSINKIGGKNNDNLTQYVYSAENSKLDEKFSRSYLYSVKEDIIKENDTSYDNLINKCENIKNENNEFTNKLKEIKKKVKVNDVNENKYKDLIPHNNYSKVNIRYLAIFLIIAIFLGFFLIRNKLYF